MQQKFIIPIILIFAVVLLGATVLLLTGDAGKAPKAENKQVETPGPNKAQEPVTYAQLGGEAAADAPAANPSSLPPGTDIFNTGAEPSSPKEAALEQIVQGKVTYSAEGVPIILPYLKNPDEEVRMEAIEAMKQLDAPEAAAALREAAKTARNAQERAAMLEAAEFVELPSILDLRQQPGQQQ